MKLKKIVSLAAAALMAVSMLTACGDSASSSQPTQPSEPTTTGYSSVFESRLSDLADLKISMSDSAALTSDLDTAIENLGSATIIDFTTAIRTAGNIRTVVNFDNTGLLVNDNGVLNAVAAGDLAVIANEMDGLAVPETGVIAVNDGTAFGNLIPTYQENDNDTVVMLYAVDGTLSERAAVEQVADALDARISALEISDDIASGTDSTTLHYTYTGSVSVSSRFLADNHGVGMHIVAVQITRSANA